jgi:hypothetical protein
MFAVYFVSRKNSDDSEPFITRMINSYTESAEKWSKRNDLHVRMIEQAGEDRVLFMNTAPHDHVNMKFPEYVGPSLVNLQGSNWAFMPNAAGQWRWSAC